MLENMTDKQYQSFWQFSSTVYQQEQVSLLLLKSQDEIGSNMNLVLLCLWLNQQNVLLSNPQIEKLHVTVMAFSQQFTKSIRSLRNNFKQQQQNINEYSEIRKKLLESELLLEQQEQQILLNLLSEFTANTSEKVPTLSDNLVAYQGYLLNIGSKLKPFESDLSLLNQYVS